MSLINELREKSANAEAIKREVIAEIKASFDTYLNGDGLENYLRKRIGNSEIKERKVMLWVKFWAYHSGCSTTHFYCGGCAWYNPENRDDWESRRYKGVELQTISDEICSYLSARLMNRMNELGFYLVSKKEDKGCLNYYNTNYYFGW